MDVLKPEIVRVEGRCYRVFDSSVESGNDGTSSYEEQSYVNYDSADESSIDFEIVTVDEGKYKHSFQVTNIFFPHIIGAKHSMHKQLESETKTSIQIPKIGQNGDIVITGPSHKAIISARHRIDLLVASSKKKVKFTHFVSIPMCDESIISGFNNFKEDILNGSDKAGRGIDEKIFQKPHKLHITCGILTIVDDKDKKQVIEALEACKKKIINPILKTTGPIVVQLQGVDCMNDDFSEVNVLYAKVVEKSGALQELVDKIVEYFVQTGLIVERHGSKVKMHVTMMNTKFRKSRSDRNNKGRDTFDATNIIQVHKDTLFGSKTLNSIHISDRHTVSDNGYYQAMAKIDLFDCE